MLNSIVSKLKHGFKISGNRVRKAGELKPNKLELIGDSTKLIFIVLVVSLYSVYKKGFSLAKCLRLVVKVIWISVSIIKGVDTIDNLKMLSIAIGEITFMFSSLNWKKIVSFSCFIQEQLNSKKEKRTVVDIVKTISRFMEFFEDN